MKSNKRTPIRTCIGCRSKNEPSKMLRIVVSDDGALYLDKDKKLFGRGIYICSSVSCIETALKKKAYSRAARRKISQSEIDTLTEKLRDEANGE